VGPVLHCACWGFSVPTRWKYSRRSPGYRFPTACRSLRHGHTSGLQLLEEVVFLGWFSLPMDERDLWVPHKSADVVRAPSGRRHDQML